MTKVDLQALVVMLLCALFVAENANSFSVKLAKRVIAGVGVAASTSLGSCAPLLADEATADDVTRYENHAKKRCTQELTRITVGLLQK